MRACVHAPATWTLVCGHLYRGWLHSMCCFSSRSRPGHGIWSCSVILPMYEFIGTATLTRVSTYRAYTNSHSDQELWISLNPFHGQWHWIRLQCCMFVQVRAASSACPHADPHSCTAACKLLLPSLFNAAAAAAHPATAAATLHCCRSKLNDSSCSMQWPHFCSDPWTPAEQLQEQGCTYRTKSYLYWHLMDQDHCFRTAAGKWAVDFIGRAEELQSDWNQVCSPR